MCKYFINLYINLIIEILLQNWWIWFLNGLPLLVEDFTNMQNCTSHLEIRISQKNHFYLERSLQNDWRKVNKLLVVFNNSSKEMTWGEEKPFFDRSPAQKWTYEVKMGPHHPSYAWCPSNFRPIVASDSEDVVTKALDWWRTCFYNKFDVICSSPINSEQFQTLSLPNAS